MSDLISKRELYYKISETYKKGRLSWGANEIFKDIIGECDSVENKGDLISKQAVLDAIQKLNIPEDMCVFEIISHIEVAIAALSSVGNKGTWIYDKSIYNWRCSECGQTPPPTGYVGKAEFMATYFKFCNHCGADMRGNDDEQT